MSYGDMVLRPASQPHSLTVVLVVIEFAAHVDRSDVLE